MSETRAPAGEPLNEWARRQANREYSDEAVYDWEAQNMRDPVKVSAYRQDEEPWRLKRLRKLYRDANLTCVALRSYPIHGSAITRMHDHKGILTIEFSSDGWCDALSELLKFVWLFAEGEPELQVCIANEGEGGFEELTDEVGSEEDVRHRSRVNEVGDFDQIMAASLGPDGEIYGHRD